MSRPEALPRSAALQQGSESISVAQVAPGYSTRDSTLPGQQSRADPGAMGVSVSEQPRQHKGRRTGPHDMGIGEPVLPPAGHQRQTGVVTPPLALAQRRWCGLGNWVEESFRADQPSYYPSRSSFRILS